MAKSKLIKDGIEVNIDLKGILSASERISYPNINISLVPAQKLNDALKNGFYQLMLKLPSESDMPQLTPRERETLKQLMEGKTSKVIADSLSIDARTVRTLLERVRNKFSCQTNIELALKVKTLGGTGYLFKFQAGDILAFFSNF